MCSLKQNHKNLGNRILTVSLVKVLAVSKNEHPGLNVTLLIVKILYPLS